MKINKNLFLYTLSIIVLCEPAIIALGPLSWLFKVLKVIVFIYTLASFILKKDYACLSKSIRWFLIFEFFLLLSTVLNRLSLYYFIYYGLTFFSICYLSEKNIRKYGYETIKCIFYVMSIFLILNVLSFFSGGIIINNTKYYFLGLRTRISETALVYLLCMTLLYTNKKNILFYISIVILLINVVTMNVSTLYIGITLIIIFNMIYKFKFVRKMIASRKSIIFILLFIIAIVFFSAQNYFSNIFNIFGKDATLSYRTFIWEDAINLIFDSPFHTLIGRGVTELGEWVTLGGTGTFQSHNQFLQVLLDGGFLALIPFLFFMLYPLPLLLKNKDNKICYKMIIILFTYFIMMITEIYEYYPQFYLLFIIIANATYIIKGENVNETK